MNEEPYIITYTGVKFTPFKPKAEDIRIEDIAHALAMTCRWGGHVREFYSVAQHSCIVSMLSSYPLIAILHDAAEAYLTDIPSLLKKKLPTYCYAEDILQLAIYERFGCAPNTDEIEEIKKIDKAVMRLEYELLMPKNEYGIGVDITDVPEIHWNSLCAVRPEIAERMFLDRFEELTKELNQKV